MGGPVRLGFEAADTGNWCEPTPPQDWKGKRLTKRSSPRKCTWGENLPYQCFGLGPEKMGATDKDRLSEAECQKQCCHDDSCEVWQWRDDKGCFWGKEGHCEKVSNAISVEGVDQEVVYVPHSKQTKRRTFHSNTGQ